MEKTCNGRGFIFKYQKITRYLVNYINTVELPYSNLDLVSLILNTRKDLLFNILNINMFTTQRETYSRFLLNQPKSDCIYHFN